MCDLDAVGVDGHGRWPRSRRRPARPSPPAAWCRRVAEQRHLRLGRQRVGERADAALLRPRSHRCMRRADLRHDDEVDRLLRLVEALQPPSPALARPSRRRCLKSSLALPGDGAPVGVDEREVELERRRALRDPCARGAACRRRAAAPARERDERRRWNERDVRACAWSSAHRLELEVDAAEPDVVVVDEIGVRHALVVDEGAVGRARDR